MGNWLRFVAGVVALIYLPGKLVIDELVSALDPFERVTLSLLVGFVTGSVAYWIAGALGMRGLFLLWPVLAGLLLLRRGRRCLRRGNSQGPDLGPVLRERSVWLSLVALAGPIAVGFALFVTLPQYDSNLTFTPDGGFLVGPGDPIFHVSIANELQRNIPPRNPFFAGYLLSYHSGSDLPAAMFAEFTGLDARNLTVRLLPPLFFALGMCSTYCFTRIWLGSTAWAALTSFLIFFGEDFSFIAGSLNGSRGDWSVEFFPHAPTTFSLFWENPMLPALAILFAALFACTRFLSEGGGGWLLLASGLSAALLECKVFTGIQVLLALVLGACLLRSSKADFRLLQVAALTLILDAPLLLLIWLGDRAGARILPRLRIDFLWSIQTVVFLISSFGLRSLAIPGIAKELRRRTEPLRLFLAIFVAAGLTTLFVQLVPEGKGVAYDNGVWFLVQSKYVIWVFTAEVLQKLTQRFYRHWGSVVAATAVISAALALSIPSTVQHFRLQMAGKSQVINADWVSALKVLEQSSLPGDVVMAPNELVFPLLAITKCHVPLATLAAYLVPHDEFQRRIIEEANFWRAWDLGKVQTDFLRAYKVKFVIVGGQAELPTTMAYGPLRKVFENRTAVVFMVSDATGQVQMPLKH